LGIDFVSYQENIDTGSPLGKAMFTIVSAIAELERNIIVERVKGGIRRAKANGKILGRPRLDLNVEELRRFRDKGLSLRSIGHKVHASAAAVHKTLQKGNM
jgi:DNA invertase Pin-like site-specific DNA recombinase